MTAAAPQDLSTQLLGQWSIKAWSALLILAGGAGLLVVLLQFLLFMMNYKNVNLEKISVLNSASQFLLILLGFVFFKSTNKSVVFEEQHRQVS